MIEHDHVYDAIVIGAGPAGISCALECIENALDVIVIDRSDRVGGQLPLIPGPLQNVFAGYYASGETLQEEMEKVAVLALSQRVVTGVNVQSFDLKERTVETTQGSIRARTLFLATGYRLRELDNDLSYGFETDIYYHSGAFKKELEDKQLVVVGGGDSALFTALDMAEICSTVTVLVRGDKLKARPDVAARVEAHPRIKVMMKTVLKRLKGLENLEEIVVTGSDGDHSLPCQKLVAKLGYVPNTELFIEQLKSDENGHVIVDQSFATSVDGVFAGGDIVRPGYDRISFASGSGMMAAQSIRRAIGHNI